MARWDELQTPPEPKSTAKNRNPGRRRERALAEARMGMAAPMEASHNRHAKRQLAAIQKASARRTARNALRRAVQKRARMARAAKAARAAS